MLPDHATEQNVPEPLTADEAAVQARYREAQDALAITDQELALAAVTLRRRRGITQAAAIMAVRAQYRGAVDLLALVRDVRAGLPRATTT